MVTSQQSSIDLFRSLRTQISANGLSAFKVFRLNEKHSCTGNRKNPDNSNKQTYKDSQLLTVCPEN